VTRVWRCDLYVTRVWRCDLYVTRVWRCDPGFLSPAYGEL